MMWFVVGPIERFRFEWLSGSIGSDAGRGRRVREWFLVSCDGRIDLFSDDVVGI